MARGWESKSVEAQQQDARHPRGSSRSPEALARADRRRGIELALARTRHDLARATVPAHRRMLEDAIAALDEQLSGLP